MATNPDIVRARARNFLNDFSSGQKAVLAVLVVILVGGGYFFTSWVSKPSYAMLFNNVSADDAASITSKLTTQHVPYQLTDGGKTILVPQAQVYQLRVNLSAQGLPAGGTGYSLLDKQGITASEFTQHVDYQRAVEGEMSKTIMAIDGIKGAIVHLVIPQADVFASDTSKPSASVLVVTDNGKTLPSSAVQAIVNLVSSSVEGLTPDNVTVADNAGHVLSAPGQDGSGAAGDDHTAQQHDYENNLASSVQDYLTAAVGTGHAFVRVHADLDFDKKQTTTQSFDNAGQAPTLSQNTSQETFSGTGNSAVGGVLGATDVAATATAGSGNNTYSKQTNVSDFGVNKIVQSVNSAPGQVQRLSVAVMVDSKVTGVDLATIKNQVAAAAGISATRGDTIAVDSMPFDASQASDEAKAAKAAQKATAAAGSTNFLETILVFVIVLVMIILTVVFGRRRGKRLAAGEPLDIRELEGVRRGGVVSSGPRSAAGIAQGGGGVIQRGGARRDLVLDSGDTYSLDDIPDASPLGVTAEGVERIQLESQISDLIEKQPDEVAQLLRTWLADRRG